VAVAVADAVVRVVRRDRPCDDRTWWGLDDILALPHGEPRKLYDRIIDVLGELQAAVPQSA
jgi:hypothetical protein